MASVFHKILVLLNQRKYEGQTERLEIPKVFWSEILWGRGGRAFSKCVRTSEVINKTLCVEVDLANTIKKILVLKKAINSLKDGDISF